jgi:uncharacterized protein YkwD
MVWSIRASCTVAALSGSLLLLACGGGGNSVSTQTTAPAQASSEVGAPQLTGDTATDGFNWFNFRRQQMGVPVLLRNSLIDQAAQGHSDYQKINNTVSHQQNSANPGFTGTAALDRMIAASYIFAVPYAYGEVISAVADVSGVVNAEQLITAIYHRFVIFEPMFKEAGAGAASVVDGYTYFTVDFAANHGYGPGLGSGHVATYPYANQQDVPTIFYSDYESPDPVPNQNEAGYPISIHADITASLTVQSFTVQARGGVPLTVRLLTNADDAETPQYAAAIIPLNVLASNTTYDVQFVGTADSVAINRSWSFTTRS